MNYLTLLTIIPVLVLSLCTGCSQVADTENGSLIIPNICMAFDCHNSTQLKIYPPVSGAHLQHIGLVKGGPKLICTTCHYNYYRNPLHKNGFVNGYNEVYKVQTPGLIVYWDAAKYPTAVWDDAANRCSGLPGATCHGDRVWATCKSCHVKPPLSKYPPISGAHIVHRYKGFTCQVCHKDYTNQPTHNNGTVNGYIWQTKTSVPGSIVIFNAAAGALASFSHTPGDCSSLGCHGTKNWYSYTYIDNSHCTVCHQYPPLRQAYPTSGQHRNENHVNRSCITCHDNYADGNPLHDNGVINGSIFDPKATVTGLIVNFSGGGTFDISTGDCSGLGGGCHGTQNWYSGGGGD